MIKVCFVHQLANLLCWQSWCQCSCLIHGLPRDKTNKVTVCPAKTQISLGIRPVWSESSQCAQLVAKDLTFLHADSEDSGQTGRMPRLIWVFAGHTVTLLVLSWGGSYGLLAPIHLNQGRVDSLKVSGVLNNNYLDFITLNAFGEIHTIAVRVIRDDFALTF